MPIYNEAGHQLLADALTVTIGKMLSGADQRRFP